MPEISVIVPVYKVERYLRRCVDSILGQTFQELEVILVDDGSPDECPNICDEFAQADKRVKVIHKKNEGAGIARNIALDNAKGKYIGFVDSDDFIHPRMYEILYQYAEQEKYDLVSCGYENVTEKTDPGQIDLDSINQTVYTSNEYLNHMYEANGKIEYVVIWNKLYHKKLFEHIRFKPGHVIDDETIIYKLVYQVPKVLYLDIPMYKYYQNDQSIMRSKKTNPKMALSIEAFMERADFYKMHHEKVLYDKTVLNIYNRIMMFLYLFSEINENEPEWYGFVVTCLKKERKSFFLNPYISPFRKVLIALSFINPIFLSGSMLKYNIQKWFRG